MGSPIPCVVAGIQYRSRRDAALALRSAGATAPQVAKALGIDLSKAQWAMRARKPSRHSTQSVSVPRAIVRKLDEFAQPFGLTPPEAARRIIAAVVETPDLARNLLDPEA